MLTDVSANTKTRLAPLVGRSCHPMGWARKTAAVTAAPMEEASSPRRLANRRRLRRAMAAASGIATISSSHATNSHPLQIGIHDAIMSFASPYFDSSWK
jgi:hypothetical protein